MDYGCFHRQAEGSQWKGGQAGRQAGRQEGRETSRLAAIATG